ncbi:hypothetical protein EON65_44835, partial [archaeon]
MPIRSSKPSKAEKRTQTAISPAARKKADTQPSPAKRGKGMNKSREQEEDAAEVIDVDEDMDTHPAKAIR